MLDDLDRPSLGILFIDGDLQGADHPLEFFIRELGHGAPLDRDLVGLRRLAPSAAGLQQEGRTQ